MVGQNGVLLIVDLDAAQRTAVQLRFNGVLAPGPELIRGKEEEAATCSNAALSLAHGPGARARTRTDK